MHEVVKSLRHKNYNPCGELTGFEREICDEASKNFPNLPFNEVMRAISVKYLAKLEHETNFPNVDALKNWSSYNLSEDERHAALNLDDFTPLQAGIAKYLVHVLHENRYNIHYNALVDFCRAFDEKKFVIGLEPEKLEREIDSAAKEADYSAKISDLNERIECIIGGSSANDILVGVLEVLGTFLAGR